MSEIDSIKSVLLGEMAPNLKRLDQLVRQGMANPAQLPMIHRGLTKLQAGKVLQPMEREAVNKVLGKMMAVVTGDDTVFQRTRMHTQRTRYQTEEVLNEEVKPHKMFKDDDVKVAKDKKEHDKLAKKGYTHDDPKTKKIEEEKNCGCGQTPCKTYGKKKNKKDMEEGIDIKKADMGEVIKDFQDSDAPQFKGKSKDKKREMAIAAKLDAEDKKEETQVDNKKLIEEIQAVLEQKVIDKGMRMKIKKKGAKVKKQLSSKDFGQPEAIRQQPYMRKLKNETEYSEVLKKLSEMDIKYKASRPKALSPEMKDTLDKGNKELSKSMKKIKKMKGDMPESYKDKFKKMLKGKDLGKMSDAETKEFFKNVDKSHKADNEAYQPELPGMQRKPVQKELPGMKPKQPKPAVKKEDASYAEKLKKGFENKKELNKNIKKKEVNKPDQSYAQKLASNMEAKIVPGFMGADGKATFKPTKKDYAANKEYQGMKKKLGSKIPGPKPVSNNSSY